MHFITRAALNRISIIILVAFFVVVGGSFAATQLKTELLPNIELPAVTIVTIYPGAAPDDVLRDVTQPIERAVAGAESLKSTQSTSNDNLSLVSLEFEYGTNMDKAQQRVKELVDRVRLPAAVQAPTVGRFSFSQIPMAVYTVNTSDTGNPNALSDLKRKANEILVPELQSIAGISSVSVGGGSTRQVIITLDEKKLADKGLTSGQVTGLLQANNITFPSGTIVNAGQSVPVVVGHEFLSVADLQNVQVGVEMPAGAGAPAAGGPPAGGAASGKPATGTGSAAATPAPAKDPKPVRLKDVASVVEGNTAADTVARTNGKPSISLVIYKTQNANTVQTTHAVEKKLDDLKGKMSADSDIVPVFTQADFIEDSLNSLIREGVSGAILAILVILVFLRSVRSTLVTAVSIPMSILIAFILLNIFDISLNIMSLAGLAVAVGRVVDDSIVVLENIYRHVHEGEPVRTAAFTGTREVASAITSSTLTTVSVFLPLGFLAGFISEVFRPFAVAVSLSLLASLLVAVTIVPVLAALFIRPERAPAGGKKAAAHDSDDTWVQRLYTPALTLALRNRMTKLATLGLALVLLTLSLIPVATGAIGTTFLSLGSDKVLTVNMKLKPGTDIHTTSDVAASLETKLHDNSMVRNYQTTIGSNTDAAASGFVPLGSNNVAEITVNLKPEADLDKEANGIRDLLKTTPNLVEYTVGTGSSTGGPSSSAFSVVVTGPEPADIATASNDLIAQLKTVPDLVNVRSNLAEAKQEIRVQVDPDKAIKHGSSAIQIAGQVRGLLTQQKLMQITLDSQSYDVVAGYDPATLNSLEAISNIKVGAVNPVPLKEIATVSNSTGSVSISRVDQQLAVTVDGTITAKSTSGVLKSTQDIIAGMTLPPGVKIENAGVAQIQGESFTQMGTALVIAIGLVYIVMVLFFGSLSTPFVIMFSLPLASIGSFLALWITGRPLGISAMIGILMLVGIVVTNAIVLLDMVEQHKRLGFNTYDSLLYGGRVRVRPIIMTAIATIIALIPLAISDEGSIIAAELGTVVIGGLFTSTMLTLIVVPVVYSLLDGLRQRLPGGAEHAASPTPAHGHGHEPELVTVAASNE